MKHRMTVTIDFETLGDAPDYHFMECCKILEQFREKVDDKFIVEFFTNNYKSDIEITSLEEV